MTPKERAITLFCDDAYCPHTRHYQERYQNECIDCIASVIQAARVAALEEAALAAESVIMPPDAIHYMRSADRVTSAIRALKEGE